MRDVVARCYIAIRRVARRLLLRQNFLSSAALNRLVSVDEALRRRGLLKGATRVSFEYRGCTFFFGDDDRGIAEAIVTTGEYEEPTAREIRGILRPGAVFVDAGANIGFYTVLGSRIVGDTGRVYSFEPTSATREFLARNVIVNEATNVVIEGFAIGAHEGRAYLRVSSESESNHLVESADATDSDISVDVVSIDEYCAQRGIGALDLVKLDIEGQELPALEGMRNVSNSSPNLAVIVELNSSAIQRSGQDVDAFFAALAAMGFSRFKVLLDWPIEFMLGDDRGFLHEVMLRHNANILARKV